MRKVLLFITLIAAMAALFIVSCSKTHYICRTCGQSINQLFAGLRYNPQGLSVQAGRDTIVYGSKGTMLHFYTNSFKNAAGNIITSGTIYLQLTEMYTPGDMIANRTSTLTPVGEPLQSRGEVSIYATMNGIEVYANKYGIGFGQSNYSGQKMLLYYSNSSLSDSAATWIVSDTTLNGTMANGTISDSDSTFHPNYIYTPPPKPWYYVFDSCSSFNFVNADHFGMGTAAATDVKLSITDPSFNKSNTTAYLVLPAAKVNITMSIMEGTTNVFDLDCCGWSPSSGAPIGMNYELVVIANKNGSYYYFEQSGTVTNGLTITATMAPESQSTILTQLAGL